MKNGIYKWLVGVLLLWSTTSMSQVGKVTYSLDTHAGGTVDVVQVDATHFRVTATPAPGYSFVKWSDGLTTMNRQHVQTMDETADMAYYAIFTKDEDMHSATGAINMTIVSSYPNPFVYQLNAIPTSGYSFCTWNNGDTIATIANYQDTDGQRRPFFTANSEVLSTTTFEHPGGVIQITSTGAMSFDFTAIPNEGYTFLSWTDGNTSNPRSYTHPVTTADTLFQAIFTRDEDFQRSHGSVSLQILNATTPTFRLKAAADIDAYFKAWNDGTTLKNHNYVESDGTCVPYFLANSATVSIFYDQHVGGKVEATLESDATYSVLAIPDSGYSFLSWADGITLNPRTHTHLETTPDSTYIAVFTKDADLTRPYGQVSVAITDQKQPAFALSAQPETTASFYAWDNAQSSVTVPYIEEDGQRLAFFEPAASDVMIRYVQRSGGLVHASPVASDYELTATPNAGYSFLSWIDGVQSNPRTITVGGQMLYRAVFTHDDDMSQDYGHTSVTVNDPLIPSFTLSAISSQTDAQFFIWSNGTKTNSITYTETDGQQVPYYLLMRDTLALTFNQHIGGIVSAQPTGINSFDFQATAAEGYTFMSWSDGVLMNPRSYTHPVGADPVTFHAVFTRDEDVQTPDGTTTVKIVNASIPNYRLTAVPNAGECSSDFYLWSNGVNTKSIYYSEEDGRRIPFFARDVKVNYLVDSSAAGSIRVTPRECSFSIEALPNEGYYFDHWQEDGSAINMRDVDYDEGVYTAVFNQNPFRVNGNYYGTIDAAIAAADGIAPVEVVLEIPGHVYIKDQCIFDGNNHTIENLHVLPGAKVEFVDYLSVNNLYLGTMSGKSAQLKNYSGYLTYSQAYLDLTLEPVMTKSTPGKWYAFCSPFSIDIATGITRQSGEGRTMSGKDYVIWEYDGTLRAATGTGWNRMVNGTIEPGRIYMMGVGDTTNTWRLQKISSSPLEGDVDIALHTYPTTDPTNLIDPGWNGIGNDLLQYATIAVSPIELRYLQVYDNAASKYIPLRLDGTTFVMGTPFFVQVDAEAMLHFTPGAIGGNLYAPKRRSVANGTTDYELRLLDADQSADTDYLDALFVSANTEATNTYQIGKDVLKILGSYTTPYIWANAYGYQLCAQDAPFVDGVAEYAISVYVPKAGNYVLSLSRGDDDVYLLQNGFTLAVLSENDYKFTASKAGTTKFVLRIGHQYQIPTSVDDAGANSAMEKFIYHDNLYIRSNEHIFNATGNLVK